MKESKIWYKSAFDSVHHYMGEVTSRVVARSGIPTDRHHLGKIILNSLRSDPDFVMQIDGATDESETNGSAVNRSVRCAIAMQKRGVRKGDVMMLTGPNHIHLCIPHYAALYLGVAVAATDELLVVNEIKDTVSYLKPKIIFCQSEKVADIEEGLKRAGLQSTIVTLNEGSRHITLTQLLEETASVSDEIINKFECVDFDPAETPACLTATSGTTGVPKAATLTHKAFCISSPYLWHFFTKFPSPTRMAVVVSPLQWLSAGFQYMFSPIMRVTRLQSSAPITPEHFAHLLTSYRPSFIISSPVLMNNLLTMKDKCDFSCLECILLGGSAVPPALVDAVKEVAKTKDVYNLYGMSEITGVAMQHDYPPPPGSSGSARGFFEYRLVDPSTGEDVSEANVPGELWLRGPTIFKGYYNNPEMTAEVLTADGWLKTGDLFYRNEYWHFFFVERIKSLLKYKNHQISPAEVEEVIRKHPDVMEVAVTGIPDNLCGDLVVACVISKPGSTPTAQAIKDLVKESLADSKQLRGGVIFMKEFPLTSSSKVNRKKLQDMVLTMDRE